MPQLTCERVQFYSDADEAAFFRFAGGIDGVMKVAGSSDSIVLDVASEPAEQSLRDLHRAVRALSHPACIIARTVSVGLEQTFVCRPSEILTQEGFR